MTDVLFRIAENSLYAAVLTGAALALRLLFKTAPRRWRCVLWGMVALRLLLPFSLQSDLSLQPDTSAARENTAQFFAAIEETREASPAEGAEFTTRSATEAAPQPDPPARRAPFARLSLPGLLTGLWLTGIAVALLCAVISFLLLRRKTAASLPLGDGVYLTDGAPSPFVTGLLRPRIYLPADLPEDRREYVLAHERTHIRRGDHLLKPLAFLLLSVYWFNPVLWLGYAAFNRDLELACDERVIRDYDPARRAAYAETLLYCGMSKRGAALSPLAFGEVGVKTRVKQALSYKKPALWILIAAVLAGAATAVCLLTVPKAADPIGVELLAENEGGSLALYKILSDGTVREKPEAPGGSYGGMIAEADCFSFRDDAGTPRVEVLKTELTYPEGVAAMMTADRKAIFYALAAVSHREIRKMEIFDSALYDGRTFVAAEYRTKDGFTSSVFLFDPVNKTLEELCAKDGLRILRVTPDKLPWDLDRAVHNALLAEQADRGWQGEYGTEGHLLLGTEETDAGATVYVLYRYASFGFENDRFIEAGGHSMPLAIRLEKTEDGWRALRIDTPQDGGYYGDSVRRLFPAAYRERIFRNSETDADALWRQCAAQAQAYLTEIGRAAEVGYDDPDRVWLDDVLDPAVVNGAIRENPALAGYPMWIGTREQLEDGARFVYAASLTPDGKTVRFEKTRYGEPDAPVEVIRLDAKTGERAAAEPFADGTGSP